VDADARVSVQLNWCKGRACKVIHWKLHSCTPHIGAARRDRRVSIGGPYLGATPNWIAWRCD
jgi:hypothetical protein